LLECPLSSVSELIYEGCSELSVVRLVHRLVSISRSLFEALQLCLDSPILVTGTPHCWPIDIRFHAWRCSDRLQHPFGWVGVCRGRRASLTNKVVDKRLRVCTDVTEVDRTSACDLRQYIDTIERQLRLPLAKSRSRSKRWNRMADGWWIVQSTAWPLLDSLVRRFTILQEV
jgi:hypothetical protein